MENILKLPQNIQLPLEGTTAVVVNGERELPTSADDVIQLHHELLKAPLEFTWGEITDEDTEEYLKDCIQPW